jgi:hypothetical protein
MSHRHDEAPARGTADRAAWLRARNLVDVTTPKGWPVTLTTDFLREDPAVIRRHLERHDEARQREIYDLAAEAQAMRDRADQMDQSAPWWRPFFRALLRRDAAALRAGAIDLDFDALDLIYPNPNRRRP